MNFFKHRTFHTLVTTTILVGSLLSGCIVPEFDNQSNNQDVENENGEVIINLTDAPGDYLSYIVDVESISLEKENGAKIETLPLTTRVDFSEYVNMTELVTSATIPSGKYVRASMTLNYSTAEIVVENDANEGTKVDTIVDNDGNVVEQIEMTVNLLNRNSLLIAPGIPAHLSLDFDLKSSNHIEYDDNNTPVSITVDPNLVASVEIDRDKEHRLRGGLNSVDTDNESFEVIVRPFRHAMKDDIQFGKITAISNADTLYEIDGVQYDAVSGIQTLAEMNRLTAVIVFGDINLKDRTINASQVLAGSSVPGGDKDFVKGHVIARDGNTLTVKGARLERKDGSVQIGKTMLVQIDETTTVRKFRNQDSLTIEAISVGQHVHILGEGDSTNDEVFNASNGLVRLILTNIRGNITSIGEDVNFPLVISAQKFDHRKSDVFDFTGTGIDAANDANPDNYEVDTATLDLDQLIVNDPIIVRGHVNHFGQAPADFLAHSLINVKALTGSLVVSWDTVSDATIVVEADNTLTAFLYDENRFHHIVRRGTKNDLAATGDSVNIIAELANHWVIQMPDERIVHTNFESFLADLNLYLVSSELTLQGIKARGSYNDADRTFKATQFNVKFR